jgi:enoyl-[acyl-carrier protein] reductase I
MPHPSPRRVCFLFSDLARAITGEIVHVDGGFHAMGTALEAAVVDGAGESSSRAAARD